MQLSRYLLFDIFIVKDNSSHIARAANSKALGEVGKLADLVVLAENPFQVETDAIKDIDVDFSIVNGEIMYLWD